MNWLKILEANADLLTISEIEILTYVLVKKKPISEIARTFEVSPARIRYILKKGKEKLQNSNTN